MCFFYLFIIICVFWSCYDMCVCVVLFFILFIVFWFLFCWWCCDFICGFVNYGLFEICMCVCVCVCLIGLCLFFKCFMWELSGILNWCFDLFVCVYVCGFRSVLLVFDLWCVWGVFRFCVLFVLCGFVCVCVCVFFENDIGLFCYI